MYKRQLLRSLAERASYGGLPVLWTEPPSRRPQARTNVELASIMVLPLELPGSERFTVALQRRTRSAFSSDDLEATMRQLERLRPRLGLGADGAAADQPAAPGRPAQPAAELSGNRGQRGPGTTSRLG